MQIVKYETIRSRFGETRTFDDFSKFIGSKPKILGKLANLYPQYSTASLIDKLGNLYTEGKGMPRPGSMESQAVEWQINVNFIKKVYFAESCTDNGFGRKKFRVRFDQKYFDKNDIIKLQNNQQLMILEEPVFLGEKLVEYVVKLTGDNSNQQVNIDFMKKGNYAMFLTCAFPEISERGYVKYQSNTEIHRNYMQTFRSSESYSQKYALAEKNMIEVKEKDEHKYYHLDPVFKTAMDNFMEVRNRGLLFSESNHDANGKPLDYGSDGQPIATTDGIITQVERYAEKFAYSILTLKMFKDALVAISQRCLQPTGNNFTVICNTRYFNAVQDLFENTLRQISPADGGWYYSRTAEEKGVAGGKVTLGGNYNSYTAYGNSLTFVTDHSLNLQHPDRGYGIILDTNIDAESGKANLSLYTFGGQEFTHNTVAGVGGMDGRTNGPVSTGLTASSHHIVGTGCPVVHNPYRAALFIENIG